MCACELSQKCFSVCALGVRRGRGITASLVKGWSSKCYSGCGYGIEATAVALVVLSGVGRHNTGRSTAAYLE